MARNKSAKRSVKRQTASNTAANVQKVEKEFFQIPAKLAALFNKDINAHKKQESALNKAVAKCLAQLNKADAKVKTAAIKAKTSSSGKKVWNAAKKAHEKLTKVHADLNKQLQTVSHACNEVVNKQARLNALHKYLGQFEKEWAKIAKQLKADAQAKAAADKAKVAAAKAKAAAKAQAKKSKTKLKAVKQPEVNSHVENLPSPVDNVVLDEPTELAS